MTDECCLTCRLDEALPDGIGAAEVFAEGFRHETVEIDGEGCYEAGLVISG